MYPNLSDKIISLKTQEIKEAEGVIRFLLRRYALVEKADVERFYQDAKERYFNPEDEMEKVEYGGRMSLLEYLFPDLGKEVEK